MKYSFISALLTSFFMGSAGVSQASEDPFKQTATFDLPEGFSASIAQASIKTPHLLLSDGGMDFWLLDAEKQSLKRIAKNTIGDWEHHLKHVQWADDQLVLFRNWEGIMQKVDPYDLSVQTELAADITNAPLRLFYWIDKLSLLVDETDFYRSKDGKVLQVETAQTFRHMTQTALLLLHDQRLITSGFHDQTIKTWSLPEGKLLKDWSVSGWFSKRQITDLALSQNRLLMATQSGHIEERSVTTGEKLWSTRPCSEPVNFYYSSQFEPSPSINVNDGLFFSCGVEVGYLEAQPQGWKLVSFDTFLRESVPKFLELMSTDGTHKHPNRLLAVETIPGRNIAILIFTSGDVTVVDKSKAIALQRLEKVKPGTAPVSYVPATQQLFIVNQANQGRLYRLSDDFKTE